MKFMKFDEPVFNLNDKNLTIRKGVKWFTKEGCFEVQDLDGNVLAIAEIITTRHSRLPFIPFKMLNYEHLRDCRSYDGLIRKLKKYYGEFDENREFFTLIFFKIIKVLSDKQDLEEINKKDLCDICRSDESCGIQGLAGKQDECNYFLKK
ncbi:hypothetical protein [Methanobacterium alcaliphilum]|uniref:hypothetical protein n=1 Tax=Methanobacterium alcaliphilum TaxID=392018 RepID=UPI00200A39D3|nr:hypothetical protein [Methanobacterium alcaliphilum]MCK9151880.1 hypothetical protein [Methanobacterium alcaliphilum]